MMETQEFVVPRSIPIILPMMFFLLCFKFQMLRICGIAVCFQEPDGYRKKIIWLAPRSRWLGAAGGQRSYNLFATRKPRYWLPDPQAPRQLPDACSDRVFRPVPA